MALDRWIALIFVTFCCIYGYAAFFTMDQLLPPFMQRNPVWPSSFPKVLAIGGIVSALIVLLGFEKSSDPDAADINYRKLTQYKLGQALGLLGLMFVYALVLRPLGFIVATFLFLALGSLVLGERRYLIIAIVSGLAAGGIWYLVNVVLGIFLPALPSFM